jgi:hypothetical protein
MTNAFSSLSVDTSDEFEETEAESEPASRLEEPLESLPPVNSVEIHQDESAIESEFFFAIQFFMTNIHELRDIV